MADHSAKSRPHQTLLQLPKISPPNLPIGHHKGVGLVQPFLTKNLPDSTQQSSADQYGITSRTQIDINTVCNHKNFIANNP